MTKPSLIDALDSLRTKEARAATVFKLVTSPSDASDIQIDGLRGDFLREGVNIAFQGREYEKGFAMAEKGGILEDLVNGIKNAPVTFEARDFFYFDDANENKSGIPPEISALPGFNFDTRERDYDGKRRESVIDWVRKLKGELTQRVLIPNERYTEAIQQMQQIGRMEPEIAELALTHFSDIPASRVVVKTGYGYEQAIARAEEHGRKTLARVLKRKHVQSLFDLKERRQNWGGVRKEREIESAILTARKYFGEIAGQEALQKGIELATQDFEGEIQTWRDELSASRETFGMGWPRERKSHDYQKELALERARTRFIERPSESVFKIIDLISRLPEEKQSEMKNKLYQASSHSVFDELGIAAELYDRDAIFSSGLRALRTTSNLNLHDERDAVKRILYHRGDLCSMPLDKRFEYAYELANLNSNEAVSEAKRLGIGSLLLSQWIIELIRAEKKEEGQYSHSLSNLAILAENMGLRNVAREFYEEAEDFGAASRNSDNQLDKAGLLLQQARKRIDYRVKQDGGLSSKPAEYHYNRNRMNLEIELIKQGVGLARGQEENKSKFYSQAVKTAEFLFEQGEYQEGALLLRRARVPAQFYTATIGDSMLEKAEASKDFAGCYWLSRLTGNEEQAAKYEVIATAMEQKVLRGLEGFIWREPKPVAVKPAQRGAPQEQPLDDDIPF